MLFKWLVAGLPNLRDCLHPRLWRGELLPYDYNAHLFKYTRLSFSHTKKRKNEKTAPTPSECHPISHRCAQHWRVL